MTLKVYLAGAVEKTNDPKTWREKVKTDDRYLEFIDPTEFGLDTYEERYDILATCLVAVERSNVVIVCYEPGVETWGTPMEVLWAYQHCIPIVVWTNENPEDMPFFLSALATDITPHLDGVRSATKLIGGLMYGRR